MATLAVLSSLCGCNTHTSTATIPAIYSKVVSSGSILCITLSMNIKPSKGCIICTYIYSIRHTKLYLHFRLIRENELVSATETLFVVAFLLVLTLFLLLGFITDFIACLPGCYWPAFGNSETQSLLQDLKMPTTRPPSTQR